MKKKKLDIIKGSNLALFPFRNQLPGAATYTGGSLMAQSLMA